MNTKKLQELREKIDDILHKEGYCIDHSAIDGAIWTLIKGSYPEEELKLYIPIRKFAGRVEPFI